MRRSMCSSPGNHGSCSRGIVLTYGVETVAGKLTWVSWARSSSLVSRYRARVLPLGVDDGVEGVEPLLGLVGIGVGELVDVAVEDHGASLAPLPGSRHGLDLLSLSRFSRPPGECGITTLRPHRAATVEATRWWRSVRRLAPRRRVQRRRRRRRHDRAGRRVDRGGDDRVTAREHANRRPTRRRPRRRRRRCAPSTTLSEEELKAQIAADYQRSWQLRRGADGEPDARRPRRQAGADLGARVRRATRCRRTS